MATVVTLAKVLGFVLFFLENITLNQADQQQTKDERQSPNFLETIFRKYADDLLGSLKEKKPVQGIARRDNSKAGDPVWEDAGERGEHFPIRTSGASAPIKNSKRTRYWHQSTALASSPTSGAEPCPSAEDGGRLFSCPTRNQLGAQVCIDDHALCDNTEHCPNGEDEDKTVCMFHKLTLNYFRSVIEAMLDLSSSLL